MRYVELTSEATTAKILSAFINTLQLKKLEENLSTGPIIALFAQQGLTSVEQEGKHQKQAKKRIKRKYIRK